MKLFFVLFLVSFNALSQNMKAQELVKNYDVSTYRPQDKGLKEFVVQVEISNLTKQLNDQLIFGKLKNVYFKLYWVYPQEIDVEVVGLPNGFTEIKNELKNLVASRLDIIVPATLEKRFEGYSLKNSTQNRKELIVASDATQMKLISEIKATFDKEGKLLSIVNQKPMMSEESDLVLVKKSFSENKWLIEEVNVVVSEGGQTTSIKTKIEHNSIEGYALPVTISSHTKQILSQGPNKKPVEREIDSSVSFKNYKINSGEASSHMKKIKDGVIIQSN